MFVRRSTHEREKVLLHVAFLIHVLGPEAVQSEAVLEGIRKQLLMALPARSALRRRLGEGRTADAYERLIGLLTVASKDQPDGGGFEDFRRAVIEAAGDRREHLDVLTELHEWLHLGRDPTGVKSQLEDRLVQQGVRIVTEVPAGDRPVDRFNFHGEGDSMTVISPAYLVEIDGTEQVVRRGHVKCQPGPSRDTTDVGEGLQADAVTGSEGEVPGGESETPADTQGEESETPADTQGEESEIVSGDPEAGEDYGDRGKTPIVDDSAESGTGEEKSS